MHFRILQSGIEQSGTGWRHTGAFLKSADPERFAGETFCPSGGTVGTAWPSSEKGTIVDSTFIESPSSTKSKEKKRDPEAHPAKKGSVWHFGYKAHIGVDSESGLVHTVKGNSRQRPRCCGNIRSVN